MSMDFCYILYYSLYHDHHIACCMDLVVVKVLVDQEPIQMNNIFLKQASEHFIVTNMKFG